jgi:hypothetical protein
MRPPALILTLVLLTPCSQELRESLQYGTETAPIEATVHS